MKLAGSSQLPRLQVAAGHFVYKWTGRDLLHSDVFVQVLRMDSWLGLLEAGHLLDADLGLQQAQLCFLWSRMLVVDEIKDFARHESLSFVDFLEALARVAELKSLPSFSDLADAGYAPVASTTLCCHLCDYCC